jgi:hypothetical protein
MSVGSWRFDPPDEPGCLIAAIIVCLCIAVALTAYLEREDLDVPA